MNALELRRLFNVDLSVSGEYSAYIYALESVANKLGYDVDTLAHDLPVSGRISYRDKTIRINVSAAHYALTTMIHEMGHLVDFLRNGHKEQPDKIRAEMTAYWYGWAIVKTIGAEHLVPKAFWRLANGYAPYQGEDHDR